MLQGKYNHRFISILLFIIIITQSSCLLYKTQTGLASYYADSYEGKSTASGEPFSQSKLTAAHKTLPLGTRVAVTNLSNGKQVVVKVNDRGPFVRKRIIDLSKLAASEIGMIGKGVTKVKIRYRRF
jgi:rare lipoprotein A